MLALIAKVGGLGCGPVRTGGRGKGKGRGERGEDPVGVLDELTSGILVTRILTVVG